MTVGFPIGEMRKQDSQNLPVQDLITTHSRKVCACRHHACLLSSRSRILLNLRQAVMSRGASTIVRTIILAFTTAPGQETNQGDLARDVRRVELFSGRAGILLQMQ